MFTELGGFTERRAGEQSADVALEPYGALELSVMAADAIQVVHVARFHGERRGRWQNYGVSGRHVVRDLIPGLYRVQLYYEQDSMQRVEVRPGATTHVTLQSAKVGTTKTRLQGTLFNDGEPLRGRRLALFHGRSLSAETYTTANGHFELTVSDHHQSRSSFKLALKPIGGGYLFSERQSGEVVSWEVECPPGQTTLSCVADERCVSSKKSSW